MRLALLLCSLAGAVMGGTVLCPDGKTPCDPDHCIAGVAECCPGGAVCPGHTCAKCECADCGLAGHAKDYNAASLLTKCPGPLGTFCQPNLCVGGTAMCCPDTGKVCPGTTCTSCECFDCTDGEREIPRAGGWDDAARLSVCADGGSRCDPDQCMDDIAECCADGKVCPGHSCAKCQCADCTPSPRTHPVQLRPIASLSPSDPCSKCGFCGALECAKCAWCNREDVEAAFGSNVTQTAALPLLAHAAASAASHGGAALAVGAVVVLGALAAVLALAGGARRKAARAAMRAVSPPARDASERLLEVEEQH